jgi:hypothetical protein
MALKVTTTVKVQDISEFAWGTVLRCSHAHRVKSDSGEWETKSYTNVDVVSDGTPVQKGDRITVEGNISSVVGYSKKDGTIGATMKINAQSILVDNFEGAKVTEDIPF